MTQAQRLAAFERMLADTRREFAELTARLDRLKAEDKTKTATFRQYLGSKMTLQYILSRYQDYGLLDPTDGRSPE